MSSTDAIEVDTSSTNGKPEGTKSEAVYMSSDNAEISDDIGKPYTFPEGKKKLAFIFEHTEFSKTLNLETLNEASEQLKKCLENLSFECTLHKNPTYEEISQKIDEICKRNDVSCIFIVVLTYGCGNKLAAKNAWYPWKKYKLKFVDSKFLAGVPKVFVIQAQGKNINKNVVNDANTVSDSSAENSEMNTQVREQDEIKPRANTYSDGISADENTTSDSSAKNSKIEQLETGMQSISTDSNPTNEEEREQTRQTTNPTEQSNRTVPKYSEFLTVLSSVQGGGFINSLCKYLVQDICKEYDFLEILTMINTNIKDNMSKTENSSDVITMPYYESTLTRPLKLFL